MAYLRPFPSLLFALVLALGLLPFVFSSICYNDAFTLMAAAVRMQGGEVLYRDFFEFYAPLTFVVLGAAYRLAGASLLVTNAVAVAIAFGVAWLLARLVRRLGTAPWAAYLAAFVWVFTCFGHWPVYSHHWVAQVPALLAVLCAVRGLEYAHFGAWRHWLGAGLALGLTGLAMQHDAASLGLALGAALLGDATLRRLSWRHWLPSLGALLAGTAAVLGLAATIAASYDALTSLLYDIVLWPLSTYKTPGGINDHPLASDLPTLLQPYTGFPNWHMRAFHVLGTFAVSGVAWLAVVPWLLHGLRQRERWTARQSCQALVALWALLSGWAMLHGRADFVHVSMYATPAVALVCLGGAHFSAWRRVGWLRYAPVAALAGVALTGWLGLANTIRTHPQYWCPPFAPDARMQAFDSLAWLRAHQRPGDTGVVAPYGGYFYFYGLKPGTDKSLMLEPGLGYTNRAEWTAFWQAVATNRPRFILIGEYPLSRERSRDYHAMVPAGYQRVGAFDSPQFGPGWPVWIYDRDANPPTPPARVTP